MPPESRMQIKNILKKEDIKDDLITDHELCEILKISSVTLRKYLREGPPRNRKRNVGDVRTIRHVSVGGQRRWSLKSIANFVYGE